MREASRLRSSPASTLTSGIMLTPVSNPDSPSTSSGKASTAVPSIPPGPPWPLVSASRHDCSRSGWPRIWTSPAATTTALSAR